MGSNFYTIKQVAQKLDMSIHGIYSAIKRKALKSQTIAGRKLIKEEDMEDFRKNRNFVKQIFVDGEEVYNLEKGTYSGPAACKFIGCNYSKLYLFAKGKILPHYCIGKRMVFKKQDLEEFKKKYTLYKNIRKSILP